MLVFVLHLIYFFVRNLVVLVPEHRVIERPRLLVLSGGIEFQRSERMIACLDTLVEAEERYMQVRELTVCRTASLADYQTPPTSLLIWLSIAIGAAR